HPAPSVQAHALAHIALPSVWQGLPPLSLPPHVNVRTAARTGPTHAPYLPRSLVRIIGRSSRACEVVSKNALLGAEQARDAELDVGPHRVQQAADLRGRDAALSPQTHAHRAVQILADGGEPSHGRRAVHAVAARDRLEGHAGDVVET